MLYSLYLKLRHLAYDKGWKKSQKASVPTICIGNVSVGGTGKTPQTELVLRRLSVSDKWAYKAVAVLSRGYKRKSRGFQIVSQDSSAAFVGDEPLQIARKFPSVTVAVDKDRIEGCKKLESADIIVLDDAFQYRKLIPSLSMVLVDYNHPVFEDKLLPWGRLRDLPSRIKEAHMVIVTKCPAQLDEWSRQEFTRHLGLRPEQKVFFTTLSYGTPQPVFPEADSRYTYASRVILVTAIANDAPLRSYLSDTYKIAKRLSFPDHHKFTRMNIRAMEAAVKEFPTACVMTTEKDAQRLRDVKKMSQALRERLFYMPVEATFLTPEQDEAFTHLLSESL